MDGGMGLTPLTRAGIECNQKLITSVSETWLVNTFHSCRTWNCTFHAGCSILIPLKPVNILRLTVRYWMFFMKVPLTYTKSDHPWAPSYPLRHPRAGWTPLNCGMVGCWQINSVANIGRKNSIQILNQYFFAWKILIWALFICFMKFLSF